MNPRIENFLFISHINFSFCDPLCVDPPFFTNFSFFQWSSYHFFETKKKEKRRKKKERKRKARKNDSEYWKVKSSQKNHLSLFSLFLPFFFLFFFSFSLFWFKDQRSQRNSRRKMAKKDRWWGHRKGAKQEASWKNQRKLQILAHQKKKQKTKNKEKIQRKKKKEKLIQKIAIDKKLIGSALLIEASSLFKTFQISLLFFFYYFFSPFLSTF